jgi:hypothetical protein
MAIASVSQERIPVTTYKDGPKIFTLSLSRDEATVLAALTGRVLGSSKNSPRYYSEEIYWALIKHIEDPFNVAEEIENETLFFNDVPNFSVPANELKISAETTDFGRVIKVVLSENAARTVKAIVGRVQVPFPEIGFYQHTHQIYNALTDVGLGSASYNDVYYKALNENIRIKPEKRKPSVLKETKSNKPKPDNWPPRRHDVWVWSGVHWIASENLVTHEVNLHVNQKDPIWFTPEQVLNANPGLELVYRAGK